MSRFPFHVRHLWPLITNSQKNLLDGTLKKRYFLMYYEGLHSWNVWSDTCLHSSQSIWFPSQRVSCQLFDNKRSIQCALVYFVAVALLSCLLQFLVFIKLHWLQCLNIMFSGESLVQSLRIILRNLMLCIYQPLAIQFSRDEQFPFIARYVYLSSPHSANWKVHENDGGSK